ncbi:hypothetical protein HCN44_001608 [Aphidius gifuensis]|uniref:Uncharacterized protein n=1 Tax=Aphidius gifuensis TaxID=684658 RepID=A0A835CSH5_APHGI|nr:hypothetical protein HCN44_001608 [Aphidius gifuensis]
MEEYLINKPFRTDEKTKQIFTDALQHCLDLLNENNNIPKNNIKYSSNNILTQKSAIIGHEMYEFFKETMIGLMTKEEIINPDTETINDLIIKEEIIEPETEKIVLKRFSVKLKRLDPDVIKNLTMKKNDTSFIDDQGKNVELQNELIVRKKTTPALISSKKNVTRTNELRYRKKRVDNGVNLTDEMKKINNWKMGS